MIEEESLMPTVSLIISDDHGGTVKALGVPEAVAAVEGVIAERDQLLRWKAEAITVIGQWEDVWMALGEPGELGSSKSFSSFVEVRRLRATIAALLAGTTNCARNLRNLGEAHADGDDPIIDGIILDSGVIPEASMSSLFIAAADALDDLAAAAVEEGER